MIGALKQRASVNMDRRSKCEVTIIGGCQHVTYWTGETIYGDDIWGRYTLTDFIHLRIGVSFLNLSSIAGKVLHVLGTSCNQFASAKYFRIL